MIGDVGVALLVELVADRADPAVHHVARRDGVGAGLGVGDRGLRKQLDGDVVVDLAVADEAAVAVRGVLAEADVGDHGQLRMGLLQRPHRHLDDALVVVGARPGLVLVGGDAEEQHGADSRLWRSRPPRRPARRSRSARCPASRRPPRGRPRRRPRRGAGSGVGGESSVSRTRPRRACGAAQSAQACGGKGIRGDCRWGD